MTSIQGSLIKSIAIILIAASGMALSAASVSQQSLSQPSRSAKASINTSADQPFKPKSRLLRQFQRSVNMLTPGHRQFNPSYLNKILASK